MLLTVGQTSSLTRREIEKILLYTANNEIHFPIQKYEHRKTSELKSIFATKTLILRT